MPLLMVSLQSQVVQRAVWIRCAAAAAAVGATDRFGKAALGAGTAMKTVQAAATGAAPINNLIGGLTRVSTATGMADAHIEAYRNSLASVPAAANSAASSLNRLAGAAANDNTVNRLQATPGNIAAQFQDIGVTAVGGMSPLLIALQQGTQLSAAMVVLATSLLVCVNCST